MKRILSGIGILAAGLTITVTAHAESFRVLSSWDGSYVQTEVLENFLEQIEKASNGQVSAQMMGPETIPPFEQLDAATGGLVDMLYTHGAYHNNATSVGMALDALTNGTPENFHDSGLWDFVDEHYQQTQGLKLIGIFNDLNGYSLMLREPLDDSEPLLEGRRIRGTPTYHGLIDYLGAAPVVLAYHEVYPSLERGVIDGVGLPTLVPVPMRLYEVADYALRPTFGQIPFILFMNLERWEGLSPDMQDLITSTAREFETDAMEYFLDIGSEVDTVLDQNGVTLIEPTSKQQQDISSIWFESVMELSAEQNADEISEIQKIAEQNGMHP